MQKSNDFMMSKDEARAAMLPVAEFAGYKSEPANVVVSDDLSEVKLRIAVDHLMPDRTQYKPYSISFSDRVWVEVTVPSEYVRDFNPSYVVLSPEGIAYVADQLATALDKMHDEFRGRNRNI